MTSGIRATLEQRIIRLKNAQCARHSCRGFHRGIHLGFLWGERSIPTEENKAKEAEEQRGSKEKKQKRREPLFISLFHFSFLFFSLLFFSCLSSFLSTDSNSSLKMLCVLEPKKILFDSNTIFWSKSPLPCAFVWLYLCRVVACGTSVKTNWEFLAQIKKHFGSTSLEYRQNSWIQTLQ